MKTPLHHVAVVLLISLQVVYGCSPVDWEEWSMEKILFNQQIVVYGREIGRIQNTTMVGGSEERTQISRFLVYCVLKNGDPSRRPISETIDIEIELFPNSCSGTKVRNNTDVLLGLMWKDGKLMWDEPNVTPDGAAFNVTSETLTKAVKVCGLRNGTPPEGRAPSAQPSCPEVPDIEKCTNSSDRNRFSPTLGFLVLFYCYIFFS